ncbi:MAG TPA: sortase [Naasia sp.]|jgi:sortase A
MRVPAAAGVLLLALGCGLLAQPLLDVSGAAAGAAGEKGIAESRSLTESADAPRAGSRHAGWDPAAAPGTDPSAYGDGIGVLHIPALDGDYRRVIAEGVGLDVLDRPEVGHFPGTAGPGEVGNFSLAGHRSTALRDVDDLGPGDRIHVQTAEGFYTYEVRNPHYVVEPTAVDVVAPVPGAPAVAPTERLLTLVTCFGAWNDADRLIVHAVFVEWRPLWAGPPTDLTLPSR